MSLLNPLHHLRAQGLRALGYLGRNEEKKEAVRDFLLGYVNHKKRTLRLASIDALGSLGEPQAIAERIADRFLFKP